MLNILSKVQALKIIMGLMMTVILFHLLVLIRIIPYEIVWAGKLKSASEMYVFEGLSILVNILIIAVLLLKGNIIKHRISDKIINGILWFFLFVFTLNTFGNLLAKSLFEKAVFTPLTLISAMLLYIIVRKDKNSQPLE